MIDLDPLIQDFNAVFPEYVDERYESILVLAGSLREEIVQELVADDRFDDFVSCIAPLIAIKNYKSQIPFPIELRTLVQSMIEISNLEPGNPPGDIIDATVPFATLVETRGFELPTVSAVFHFCHPNHFPIVDRYVNAADRYLFDIDTANEFQGRIDISRTGLPAPKSSTVTKRSGYANFINFTFRIMELQQLQHGRAYSIRDIDKGLMVLGRRLVAD